MVTIMKASAGSGKTYNLAKTYINLLIKNDDRYAYRHILAVTFTNKATDEMKSRILKELHILSTTPDDSDYLTFLMKEHDMSKQQVCQKAQTVLYDILHDYSAFAVSTIDRFFQHTLKAFSREIGQFASYQVELDRDSLIAESVDRVLDSLTEDNKDLLPWLTDSVLEQIQQGGRYNLEGDLLDRAKRLKSAQRQDELDKMGGDPLEMCSKEKLRTVKEACRDLIGRFNERLRRYSNDAVAILGHVGLQPEDTYSGFMKVLRNYLDLEEDQRAEAPTPTFMKRAVNPEMWFSKAMEKKHLADVNPDLLAPLEALCNLWKNESKVYYTAFLIDGQLYGLGVAAELEKAFNELMKEKNVLCIDDSNTILRGIIGNSPTPFIYEKLGVRYENFLLDEFQDTSGIQWENFFPLIDNSDSQGGENLIVGDVKQSIYRWRGSDWKLLNATIPGQFPRHDQVNLQTNYRSLSTVVEFNNAFFKVAARIMDKISGHEKAVGPLGQIYADVRQEVAPSKKAEGVVSMTFCPENEEVNQVYLAIQKAVAAGARLSEIAVLVRNKKHGQAIAAYLLEHGVPVLTEEALKAKSALTVRRLVSLMSCVDNPENTVNSYLARTMEIEIPDCCTSLIDMAESLFRSLKKVDGQQSWKDEAPHIQTFMDTLLDYVASNGNNLRGFLKYWDEHDPSICSSPTGESVKVMTIHKSKGLDFPYVILPYVEKIVLYKPDQYWCSPDLEGTELEESAAGLYDVNLSSQTEKTCFSASYQKEKFLQQVDNINALYVALTRASLGNHIIAVTPPASQKKAFSEMNLTSFKDFSQILYWYAERMGMEMNEDSDIVNFQKGRMPDFNAFRKVDQSDIKPFEVVDGDEYPSVPLNFESGDAEVDVCERGRLKFTADALEFFKDDNHKISHSKRLRGVVLHEVLSRVVVPEDLEKSLMNSYHQGDMTYEETSQAREMLSRAIDVGSEKGWFPSDRTKVMNEVALMDVGGREYRPDRVVLDGDKVMIIDYKFGESNSGYANQVMRYAKLWKKMGYDDIKAFLWYVETDEIVEVL